MSSIIEEDVQMNNHQLPRIALIACGCFSPPTPLHFRMFEIARDHFEMQGTHEVVGGIVSPTHDSYQKKGLTSATHRLAMLKLGLQSSSWIRISDFEVKQQQWTRTLSVLQHHQNYMNNYINSPKIDEMNGKFPGWLPSGLQKGSDGVQLKLLCGADLLESFSVPGLWADEDVIDIVGNHGLVVISRGGFDPGKFIFESDILTKYKRNITLITNWVSNDISSTNVRRLLGRGQSVKYLIDDKVIEYIRKHGLFNYKSKYITTDFIHTSLNVHKLLQFNNNNQVKKMNTNATTLSSNENTPSDDGDDDNVVAQEEHMDEFDYSIKNILTSVNLDNRKTNVFCCGESETITTKMQLMRPGQAVQVITTEKGGTTATNTRLIEQDEQSKAKKIKTTADSVLSSIAAEGNDCCANENQTT